MKSLYALIALASIGIQTSAKAASPAYLPIAKCSAVVENLPITFDFFEEFDSESGAVTGKGFALQTMGPVENSAKFLGRIEVSGPETAKAIKLYAFANPDTLFSEFTIDTTKETKVEFFAKNFGSVWATLTCSAPFPTK